METYVAPAETTKPYVAPTDAPTDAPKPYDYDSIKEPDNNNYAHTGTGGSSGNQNGNNNDSGNNNYGGNTNFGGNTNKPQHKPLPPMPYFTAKPVSVS